MISFSGFLRAVRQSAIAGRARSTRIFFAGLLLGAIGSISLADDRVSDLFKDAKYKFATLSPNGKYLAVTASIGGRIQLGMFDLETGSSKVVAGYEAKNLTRVKWINDERLVFSMIDMGGDFRSSAAGLYAIGRDGGKMTILMESPEHLRGFVDQTIWSSEPRAMRMISRGLGQDANSVIAIGYFPTGEARLYRVNSLNGRRSEFDYRVTGITRDFVVDHKNTLRVVVTSNTEYSEETIWYRDQEGSDWRRLSAHPALDAPFTVLGFDNDGVTMIVSAPTNKGFIGIFEFDFKNNRVGRQLAADEQVDVDGELVYAPDSRKLLGVQLSSAPPKTIWFDASMQVLQASLDTARPGLVNEIQVTNRDASMLVHSYSSTEPGSYSFYQPAAKKLTRYLTKRPWIDSATMAPKLVYDYVARDGLPIMAYLTLPKGRAVKSLPLIVLVHGGPWARDEWEFDPDVQLLAGMGYAVLQPQFRGSTGFGIAHFKKSFGQWGLAMQDDLTDGVLSLTKQGVVDSRRVCIMGASYGGYAAMMRLVKDPNFYRCAVNLFGVTNLFYHSSKGRDNDPVENYSLDQVLGDPVKLRNQFEATSPSLRADAIGAPVFMVYGVKDYRVPLIHGEEMRDGLKKAGKVFEFMKLEDDEHGIADEKTRISVFKAIAAFLRHHNPPD